MHHFKPQWWLEPISNQQLDQRLLIQEPATIRARGRPAGAQNKPKDHNTREPSSFEYTEQAIGNGGRRLIQHGQRRQHGQ
jgi:hypothetical protein